MNFKIFLKVGHINYTAITYSISSGHTENLSTSNMEQNIFRNKHVYTYILATTISIKRDHEFEKEQRSSFERKEQEGRKGRKNYCNYIVISK